MTGGKQQFVLTFKTILMIRKYIIPVLLAAAIVSACKKDEAKPAVTPGSISIVALATKDTLMQNVPAGMDSVIVIGLKAILNSGVSTGDHFVSFKADTSHMVKFRARFGSGTTLPSDNFRFFRSRCRIPAGTTVSDMAELNIFQQTSLRAESEYVLPVVISEMDGNSEAAVPGEVLYIIVKTGRSPIVLKNDWTIHEVSSQNTSGPAINLLDNNVNTTWVNGNYGFPQHVTFNFGETITFSGVSYEVPAINYATLGGYPTRFQIETSLDGVTWDDKGTFDGVTTAVAWQRNIGTTNARYLRYTVHAATKFWGVFDIVYIGDISLQY